MKKRKKQKTYSKKLTKKRKQMWMEISLILVVMLAISVISIADRALTIEPVEAQVMYEKEEIAMFPEAETDMKRWVLIEVYKAGLNPDEVECLIKYESNWDDYAYHLNNNGTSDLGLWMINSIHKDTISPKDRLDYKKATRWAINKRLHDGNYFAWYGYINNCKQFYER